MSTTQMTTLGSYVEVHNWVHMAACCLVKGDGVTSLSAVDESALI